MQISTGRVVPRSGRTDSRHVGVEKGGWYRLQASMNRSCLMSSTTAYGSTTLLLAFSSANYLSQRVTYYLGVTRIYWPFPVYHHHVNHQTSGIELLMQTSRCWYQARL
eukprot:80772-Rhodomonas_salina.3